jgi:hypothetical protein
VERHAVPVDVEAHLGLAGGEEVEGVERRVVDDGPQRVPDVLLPAGRRLLDEGEGRLLRPLVERGRGLPEGLDLRGIGEDVEDKVAAQAREDALELGEGGGPLLPAVAEVRAHRVGLVDQERDVVARHLQAVVGHLRPLRPGRRGGPLPHREVEGLAVLRPPLLPLPPLRPHHLGLLAQGGDRLLPDDGAAVPRGADEAVEGGLGPDRGEVLGRLQPRSPVGVGEGGGRALLRGVRIQARERPEERAARPGVGVRERPEEDRPHPLGVDPGEGLDRLRPEIGVLILRGLLEGLHGGGVPDAAERLRRCPPDLGFPVRERLLEGAAEGGVAVEAQELRAPGADLRIPQIRPQLLLDPLPGVAVRELGEDLPGDVPEVGLHPGEDVEKELDRSDRVQPAAEPRPLPNGLLLGRPKEALGFLVVLFLPLPLSLGGGGGKGGGDEEEGEKGGVGREGAHGGLLYRRTRAPARSSPMNALTSVA